MDEWRKQEHLDNILKPLYRGEIFFPTHDFSYGQSK